MRELVFVHGRAQEHKDSVALKAEWIEAWQAGLEKSGLRMPIAEDRIRFPYYGQTLYDLLAGVPADEVAGVVVRGETGGAGQEEFARSLIDEISAFAGVTEQQLRTVAGNDVVERGPQNWEWFQGILRVIDRRVPFASGASIALITNDVYQYLTNQAVYDEIDTGVRQAFTPGAETVVVAHSLGTVVAYKLLDHEGASLGWNVPLFVTVGSPLGVKRIFKSLKPVHHPACAAGWFNAMDERDVVALYPLDEDHFDVDPAIENKTDVRNFTPNRHGIAGYLSDPDVARRIYDALVK